jgi:hypothetical protein
MPACHLAVILGRYNQERKIIQRRSYSDEMPAAWMAGRACGSCPVRRHKSAEWTAHGVPGRTGTAHGFYGRHGSFTAPFHDVQMANEYEAG